MWLLVSVSQPDLKFVIVGDHQYVVGRQSCDIVIPDASVSRRQAILTMVHHDSNVAKSFMIPTLTLEDVSKFGTFVNGKQVKNPGGNTVALKHNDEIKFGGSPASVFKAVYESFIATTSCLEKAPKKILHKVMCLLGGHVVRDWRPCCDLLIMSNINVTIKVICAINNQKHIVTPKYLDDLYNYYKNKGEKPNPVDYLPEVVDSEVPQGVSFHPNAKRATLLEGIKFYFLSALQFNKTNLAVSTAGGQPILLEDGTEEDAETMTQDGTVVVAVTKDILVTLSPSCQRFVKLVIGTLKRNNLRMVTDPEIGWSILTCKTDDFCNPRSSFSSSMLSTMASQSLSQMTEMDTAREASASDIRSAKRVLPISADHGNEMKESSEPLAKKVKTETLLEESSNNLSVDDRIKRVKQDEDRTTKPSPLGICTNPTNQLIGVNDVIGFPQQRDTKPVIVVEDDVPQSDTSKKSGSPPPQAEPKNIFARVKALRSKQVRKEKRDDSDDESSYTKRDEPRRRPMLFDDDEEDDNVRKIDSPASDSKTVVKVVPKEEKKDDSFVNLRENVQSQDDELAEPGNEPILNMEINTPVDYEPDLNTTVGPPWMNKNQLTCDVKLSTDIDTKPDTELLRDKEGKLLCNMCEVQIVELVSHKPQKEKVTTVPTKGGRKNFKKFRKTENIGSKTHPIIGIRDLEVYLPTTGYQDLAIFSNGIADEEKKQEEEKRNQELFNWDDNPKKSVSRRAR